MSHKWKITFSFAAGPIPQGQVIYVTTDSPAVRPSEAEIKEALRSVGIETDNPWTGISGTYRVD